MDSGQLDERGSAPAGHRRAASLALAIVLHAAVFWVLALSISFQFVEREERLLEPKIVALAPRLVPPPPDVEKLGPTDTVVTTQPRFRPRIPTITRERRPGDPALAIWKYLCNRDEALSEATRVGCPAFNLGDIDLGLLDPLNRQGDVGALFGPDTATMSLEEVGRKKGWFKPKAPWPAEGARARGDGSPFDFLPKEKSRVWGGP